MKRTLPLRPLAMSSPSLPSSSPSSSSSKGKGKANGPLGSGRKGAPRPYHTRAQSTPDMHWVFRSNIPRRRGQPLPAGSDLHRRNFFGMSEIFGVIANPAETVRSLTESRKLLDEARREISEGRERAQLRPAHTFSRLPGFFERPSETRTVKRILEGDPSFTVLFGASSVGKTALLREVLCLDDYHVLHFDLRIAGFADLSSLYTSLSAQMELYFESLSHLEGYNEFEKEAWGFKHDRLSVERRIADLGPELGHVKTSDVARLMELFQSSLLKYWQFQPDLPDDPEPPAPAEPTPEKKKSYDEPRPSTSSAPAERKGSHVRDAESEITRVDDGAPVHRRDTMNSEGGAGLHRRGTSRSVATKQWAERFFRSRSRLDVSSPEPPGAESTLGHDGPGTVPESTVGHGAPESTLGHAGATQSTLAQPPESALGEAERVRRVERIDSGIAEEMREPERRMHVRLEEADKGRERAREVAKEEKETFEQREEREKREKREKRRKKRVPVIFFDEAHKLPALIRSTEAMKCILDSMLVLTKQDRLCHVVHATSDPFYQTWLRQLNVMQHCKIITVGDCSKAEARAFYEERLLPRVPEKYRANLDFESLYIAFGGKLAHWSDYITDYCNANGRLTVERSTHFLQAHALLNLHLIHSSQLPSFAQHAPNPDDQPTPNISARNISSQQGFRIYSPLSHTSPHAAPGSAEAGDDSAPAMTAEFSAEQLLKVMSRITGEGVRGLTYFGMCREMGVRAVDGMVKGRILELRWTETITREGDDRPTRFRPSASLHGQSSTAVDRMNSTLSGEWVAVSPTYEEEEEEQVVLGPMLVPTTPIMRYAMREVVSEYEDVRTVSEYASMSDGEPQEY